MTRSYLNSNRINEIESNLSPKEIAILITLNEVRIATATQLERLHFIGETSRNRSRVLQSLTTRGLVARLERSVGGRHAGSDSYVYTLGLGGQRLLRRATEHRVRRPATVGTQFMAHALQVTECLVRLRDAERQGQIELLDFEAEPRCWRRFPGPGGSLICKPDALVTIGIGSFRDDWSLEIDRNTEGAGAIKRQLEIYRRHWSSGVEQARRGVYPRVLWLVPNEKRHQELVDVIARQPAETWQLHMVTLYDNAIAVMAGGAS